jgi:hypothetical protein
MSNVPLEPQEEHPVMLANVVDLGSVRVRYGLTPYKAKVCEHKSVTYNQSERRIWCQDCERTIDSFDGFVMLLKHWQEMERAARHKLAQAEEARQATLVRRAAKELDRDWGHKRAPCCPHCRGGLLPEDFDRGAAAATSRELEVARRKRASQPTPTA